MSRRDLVKGLEVGRRREERKVIYLFLIDAWIQASKEIKLIDDRGGYGYYC